MNKRQRKKCDTSPLTSYKEERQERRICIIENANTNRKAKRLIEAGIQPRNRYEKTIIEMYEPPKYRWRTMYNILRKERVKEKKTLKKNNMAAEQEAKEC